MFRQQLAAVVTAVRCVLVAKKSKNDKQAVSPPSRTILAGYSTDIFSTFLSRWITIEHVHSRLQISGAESQCSKCLATFY